MSNFVKHILSHESCEVGQYCDFVVQDKNDLKEHDHEVMVIMHTMAQQVDHISESFKHLKMNFMKAISDNKQEEIMHETILMKIQFSEK